MKHLTAAAILAFLGTLSMLSPLASAQIKNFHDPPCNLHIGECATVECAGKPAYPAPGSTGE